MKIAFIADVHSNHLALQACLDYIYAHEIDGIAFLGDYVSDCPYPQKTLSLIHSVPKKYMTWHIRGNREEYMINHHHNPHDDWSYGSKTGSLLYTYENLTSDDIEYFERLPIFDIISIDGCEPITICHGSASAISAYLDNPDAIDEALESIPTNYLVGGHLHSYMKYEKNKKTYIRCSTLGMPKSNDIRAEFLIMEYSNGKWQDSRVFVEYDIQRAVDEFYESGLIDKAKFWAKGSMKTLMSARNYPFECLQLANKLAHDNSEELQEKHWLAAAKQLGID